MFVNAQISAIFFILTLSVVYTQDVYPVYAYGASLPRPIYQKLFFAYNIRSDENITLDYDSSSSGEGHDVLKLSPLAYDFTATEFAFSETEIGQYPSIVQFPILGSAVTPVCQLPGYFNRVLMTPNLLYLIFTGRVTYWHHPAIIDLNPGLDSLTDNGTITIGLRFVESGTTRTFTEGMTKMSSAWAQEYGVFSQWPEDLLAKINYRRVRGSNTGMAIFAEENDYAITYLPMSFASDNGIQVIDLQTDEGSILLSDDLSKFEDLELNELLTADIKEHFDWPFVTLSYIAWDNTLNCEKQQKLARFFVWASKRERYMVNEGYFPLPENARQQVEDYLFSLTCSEDPLIENTYVNNYTTLALVILIAIVSIGVILALTFFFMIQYYSIQIEVMVHIAFFLGSETMVGSLIFWYLEPSNMVICQLRIWLLALGLMLMNGVSVSRSWQLVTINKMKINDKIDQKSIFHLSVLVTMVLQIILLLAWFFFDPFTSVVTERDDITFLYEYQCASEDNTLWVVIESILIGLLTLWGIFTVYNTWKLTKHYDPRFTLFTLYFSTIVVLCAVFFFRTVDGDEDIFYVISGCTLMIIFGFWLPHMIQFFKVKRESKSGSSKKKSSSPMKVET
eukprot:TRINITY_DN3734_c0_g1_i1.p1 TRINITY_DN3734_c0_g1~~TRINITY_DN3734_c0_g1_i1.p1  ORF type:complete len:621 (-),score=104.26 TRINITY_DN3734_c0_g1_i1:110-1972(-)